VEPSQPFCRSVVKLPRGRTQRGCLFGAGSMGNDRICRTTILLVCVLVSLHGRATASGEPLQTGPKTERRFPPLIVPRGFKSTLFACDPLVEYPSVIARGPRPASVFVAHDYLTGLGTQIARRDEIRLVEDTDGDGYADKSTVFASGFNSIQGLAYHAGHVFVMHAPLLTVLRDTDGDGVADERHVLLSGLGLPPEKDALRLHNANGVVVGHDGWLYLAVGDHGVDVTRPEGDRLVLHGGGVLRCRPDGRDLHVFATGLRNIYDVTLDEELNVFVRDNENDGGDYMIRVCHSFHGADHGYPYRYYEHPDEALPPLADLGRGSSAGGVCYLETAFPPEFRGNLFFCEWGRSIVRYDRQRLGSSFAPMKEMEFATGAATDPYGFKPTDVIVDRDGSLLVSDWGDDQRPKRGRGRLYRISYIGRSDATTSRIPRRMPEIDPTIGSLDSPSYDARVAAQEALERNGRDGLSAVRRALQEHLLAPSVGCMPSGPWPISEVENASRLSCPSFSPTPILECAGRPCGPLPTCAIRRSVPIRINQRPVRPRRPADCPSLLPSRIRASLWRSSSPSDACDGEAPPAGFAIT